MGPLNGLEKCEVEGTDILFFIIMKDYLDNVHHLYFMNPFIDRVPFLRGLEQS